MRWLALIAATIAISAPACGQILQSGPVVPGHLLRSPTANVASDAGSAAGGAAGSNATELGLVKSVGSPNGLPPFSIMDAPTNSSSGYHSLTIDVNSTTGAIFDFEAFGAASPLSVFFKINGITYPFPGAGSGDVLGPSSSPSGGIVVFNGTSGKLLKDSGIGASLLAGNQSGTNPWLNGLIEQTPGEISTLLHGIYTHNTSAFLGLSADFTLANDPTNANSDSPRAALFVLGTNKGSVQAGLGLQAISNCTAINTYCGNNIIALSTGTVGVKRLLGLEIDQQFAVGDTVDSFSIALAINAFNVAKVGPAVQTGGVNGGTFTNGFMCGDVASDGTCYGNVGGAGTPDSLMNTSNTTYTTGAIRIANNNGTATALGTNNQLLRFDPPSGTNAASIMFNASTNVVLTNPTGANYFLTTGGGSQYFGTTSSLATNATTGFVFLPSMAGLPVGAPTGIPNWANPIVIDTTDNKLCFYTTAWKCMTGT